MHTNSVFRFRFPASKLMLAFQLLFLPPTKSMLFLGQLLIVFTAFRFVQRLRTTLSVQHTCHPARKHVFSLFPCVINFAKRFLSLMQKKKNPPTNQWLSPGCVSILVHVAVHRNLVVAWCVHKVTKMKTYVMLRNDNMNPVFKIYKLGVFIHLCGGR